MYPEERCRYRAVRTRRRGEFLSICPSERHPLGVALSQDKDEMRKVIDNHLAFLSKSSHSGFTEHLPHVKPTLHALAWGQVTSLGTALSLPF